MEAAHGIVTSTELVIPKTDAHNCFEAILIVLYKALHNSTVWGTKIIIIIQQEHINLM